MTRPGMGPKLRVLLLVVFGMVWAASVYGLYIGAVRTFDGQRVDEAAIVGRSSHEAVQRATNQVLDTVSVTSLGVAAVLLALLALTRRRPRLAVGIGVMIIGANLTTQVLKSHVLGRPDLLHRPGAALVPSFPSGHATVAMSVALALMLAVPPRLRVLAGSIGVAYAVAVGAGTLTAGWHRPSDVIAAYFVAASWTALVTAVLLAGRGAHRAPTPMIFGQALSSWRLTVAGSALIAGAAIVSGTVLVVLDGRKLASVELTPSYLGAVAAIAGSALMILAVLLWLLRGTLLDPPHQGVAEDPEGPPMADVGADGLTPAGDDPAGAPPIPGDGTMDVRALSM